MELLISCIHNIEFLNAFYFDGANREASDKEISGLDTSTKASLLNAIHQEAARGHGFNYGRHYLSKSGMKDLPTSKFLSSLNENSFLSLVEIICSSNNLGNVDAQVTRFQRGNFLTRHNDNVDGDTRKIAYVLSLSQNWHPDWGGLLQFFDKDGTPSISLSPIFNNLVLFDVNKVHSVTSIAEYSPRSRYSITGWIREIN